MLLFAAAAFTPVAHASDTQPAPRPPSKSFGRTNSQPPRQSDWQPVVAGRLKNGLRFAIMPRKSNEAGIGLLARNEGGFIAEQRPGERGLAHLIEHLFLVSPTANAPDDANHFLRIGLPLTFSAPSAGTTSWRETNLFVSTKTRHQADLDTLLALFRETLTQLSFRADIVDEQRADVMREMAGRWLGNDIYASYIAAAAPGSPTDVIDAQNSDDVPGATIETIRQLYRRLYRPENIMIVIVGNVDPAATTALIQKQFGNWEDTGPVPTRPTVSAFRPQEIAPISYSSRAEGRRIAMITIASETPPPPSTRGRQTDEMLMDMLALRAVNNRLANAQPASPPGKVGFFIENGEQGHRLLLLWDNFAADEWRPAIVGLTRMTCALGTIGFSASEWTVAKQNLIDDLDNQTKAMASVPNVEVAKDLSHAIATGRGLIPPNELLGRARKLLPGISLQAGNDWWRQQWHAGVEHIRVESPELGSVGDQLAAIRATIDDAVGDGRCKVRP
ncbi:MAG: M16 family metallopeptidase [Sphingomonas sp.]